MYDDFKEALKKQYAGTWKSRLYWLDRFIRDGLEATPQSIRQWSKERRGQASQKAAWICLSQWLRFCETGQLLESHERSIITKAREQDPEILEKLKKLRLRCYELPLEGRQRFAMASLLTATGISFKDLVRIKLSQLVPDPIRPQAILMDDKIINLELWAAQDLANWLRVRNAEEAAKVRPTDNPQTKARKDNKRKWCDSPLVFPGTGGKLLTRTVQYLLFK